MAEKKRLLIIDSNSLIHRAYHALPPLTTKKGELVNAVYGFLLVLFKTLKDFRPDYIAATFDLREPTFRHKQFKEYKAKRPPTPEELCKQIPRVKEILKNFNIPIFEKKGFEADDLIGTIAKKAETLPNPAPLQRGGTGGQVEIIILSGDLDALQLIDKITKVYALKKGLKDTILYDENKVQERYGLLPSQLIDFKALRGDPSDNIPGVLGIGEKTAIQLIKQFRSLENLYQEIEKKTEKVKALKPGVKKKLIKSKEQAFCSQALVQIRRDVPIDFDLKKCEWGTYAEEKIIQMFQDLGFFSLIKRVREIKQRNTKATLMLF